MDPRAADFEVLGGIRGRRLEARETVPENRNRTGKNSLLEPCPVLGQTRDFRDVPVWNVHVAKYVTSVLAARALNFKWRKWKRAAIIRAVSPTVPT